MQIVPPDGRGCSLDCVLKAFHRALSKQAQKITSCLVLLNPRKGLSDGAIQFNSVTLFAWKQQ